MADNNLYLERWDYLDFQNSWYCSDCDLIDDHWLSCDNMLWNIVKEKLQNGPVLLEDPACEWMIYGTDDLGNYHWGAVGSSSHVLTYSEHLMEHMVNEPFVYLEDYFEPSSVKAQNNGACTCDLYATIMRYGCQCGGK